MGKTLDALLGRRFKTSKFKATASLAISRLAVLKNQRQARCSIARSDVVGFLKSDNHDRALLRVEQVIKEQNMFDVFVILEGYCHLMLEMVHLFEQEKDCPEDLVEAVSSLIYASVRCGEFPELEELRMIFTSRFGKEFAARAVELRNNCGVNPKIIQKFSTRMPSLENKMKVLKEIASDNNIDLPMEETSPDTTLESKESEQEKQQQEAGQLGGERNESDERERMPIAMEYKDVATAAQAAFESAANAAAAARAAVVLSRSDPHHPSTLYLREDLSTIEPTKKAKNNEDPQENEHVRNNDLSGGTLLRRSFSGSISDSSSDDEDEIRQGNVANDHESDNDDKTISDRVEGGGFEGEMEKKSGGAEPLKINRNPISVRTKWARGR